MSFTDPSADSFGQGSSGQPYMGQQPQFSPPDSFAIPMVPGNPYFRQRQRSGRRRGPRLGCLISLVILAVLLLVSYNTFARNWLIFGPTTITVNTHATLVINSQRYEKIDLPTIHIHAGTDANKIIFQVISPGNVPLPWNFGIDGFQQNSDSSVIIVDGDPVGGRKLDVTVPPAINLKINTNSANIDVTSVTGQMTVISNDGTISFNHCYVQGTSLLNDNTGAITVTQSVLNGQVTLSNNNGPITFTSSIGTTGTYAIENNQGSIDATLPQNSSFHVNGKTNSGSITTDFPGMHVQGKEVHSDVGNPPRALLSLNTNAGTIALHKQKGA
jgi:Putative adhesin